MKLQNATKPPTHIIKITTQAKDQALWWLGNIKAATEDSTILDPRHMESMRPVHIFSDAAGGDASNIKNGIGAFTPQHHWIYMPWPPIIRDNRMNSEGTRFANKLCTLEGFAALAAVTAIPEVARNRELIVHCDNSGFVAVYKKKHSKCEYAYTVAKALHDVGEGL